MKVKVKVRLLFLLSMVVVVTAINLNAQPDYVESMRRQEVKMQREATLQAAADVSDSARALKAKVDAQEYGAILEAVKTQDSSLIPYLKLVASDEAARSRSGSFAFEAHVGLVKLGDAEAFSQILTEFEAENRGLLNGASLMKLGLIANKQAYRLLYTTLDNDFRPSSGARDVFFPTRSVSAMSVLAITVKDPPTAKDTYNVQAWKAWFERNRHLID